MGAGQEGIDNFNFFSQCYDINNFHFKSDFVAFLDGPAEASVTNGGTAAVTALNDDLDIFGPMISNPLPAAAVPPAQVKLNKSIYYNCM